jgi:hypothetical protein
LNVSASAAPLEERSNVFACATRHSQNAAAGAAAVQPTMFSRGAAVPPSWRPPPLVSDTSRRLTTAVAATVAG